MLFQCRALPQKRSRDIFDFIGRKEGANAVVVIPDVNNGSQVVVPHLKKVLFSVDQQTTSKNVQVYFVELNEKLAVKVLPIIKPLNILRKDDYEELNSEQGAL